jgi:HK97 family phage prohead protease
MKTEQLYSTKGSFELKDLDASKRQVAFYLSKFDVVDADNDVIRRGAFTKSLLEHGVDSASNRKIAFLRHHDWTKQIGKFVTLQEDNVGLFAIGELGRSTIGEDAFKDYEDGIIREHSIGFRYVMDKMKWNEDTSLDGGGFFDIKEVMLWEGSAVTFGANELTNVVEVIKSEDKIERAVKLSKEIDVLVKALASGKGTDERLFTIEMQIKRMTQELSTLAMTEPNQKIHSEVEIKSVDVFDWSLVLNNLKK